MSTTAGAMKNGREWRSSHSLPAHSGRRDASRGDPPAGSYRVCDGAAIGAVAQLPVPSASLYMLLCASRPKSSVISSQPASMFCKASSTVISPAR